MMLVSLIAAGALMLGGMQGAGTAATGEYAAAHSKRATDRHGFEPSLYRGKWWKPGIDACRERIMYRESRFQYGAANPVSSARGAYMFLDRSWRDGLVWMFLAESKETNDGLRADARALRDKPIHHWSRYWQDRAFYTAYAFGKGRQHWAPVPAGC